MKRKSNIELIKEDIANTLLKRAIGDLDQVSCEYLLEQDLPEFLKKFVKGHSLKLLNQEKPFRYSCTEHFDFTSVKFQKLFERLYVLLLTNTKFRRNEIEKLIATSVNLQFDLLLAPRQTLERLFYQSINEFSKEKLLRALVSISNGWDYINRLIQVIKEYEGEQILKLTFSLLAKRVEEEIYFNNQYQALLDDFVKLENLIKLAGSALDKGYSTRFVIKFLVARGHNNLVDLFFKRDPKNTKKWLIGEVSALLTNHIDQADYGNVPADEIDRIITVDVKRKVKKENNKNDRRIDVVDVENFSINRAEFERQPPGPYPEMKTLINHNDQRKMIKKIFGKNPLAYMEFINKIDLTQRWKDAKIIIDNELEKRDLNPSSKEALRLGDLVFSRYFSRQE